jgi:hypothetical protein
LTLLLLYSCLILAATVDVWARDELPRRGAWDLAVPTKNLGPSPLLSLRYE